MEESLSTGVQKNQLIAKCNKLIFLVLLNFVWIDECFPAKRSIKILWLRQEDFLC